MKDNKELRIDTLEQVSGGRGVTATRGKKPERIIKAASIESVDSVEAVDSVGAVAAVASFRGLSSLPKILPY